ncbi:actin-3, muscle-specific [Aspergillus lucknowensis]|uniref:Actin-3, muscle-specific n=1 Tax=Aspergillus lucknowensis TaxID=176173 RepID=A0ABR4LG58_9EURO
MMGTDERLPIVLDNGSFSCKAGFGGDDEPKIVFPNLVGRPPNNRSAIHPILNTNDSYIGTDAQAKRGILSLEYPITRGVVTNRPAMEEIWTHITTNALTINPEEHQILITEPPHNPRTNREHMAEFFLEGLQTPGFHVAVPGYLAILTAGRNTGIAVSCGEGVLHTFTVTNNYTVPRAIARVDLAGVDVTASLRDLLTRRGVYLGSTAEWEIAREMKEELCYVAEDYARESESKTALGCSGTAASVERKYRLPDGREIVLGTERFEAAEALFTPSLVGRDIGGIQEVVFDAIMKCDIDIRRDLAYNVILTGGSTLLPGFATRLARELSALAHPGMHFNIPASSTRLYDVWIGGSILSSLSFFQKMWITRQEYEEVGVGIVHRKCFPNASY